MATTVPLVSSGTAGPLKAIHLPRLWLKLTLSAAGKLPEGYDECGAGFDAMTISALGLDRDKVIDFVKRTKPTYIQFEEWVVAQNGGRIDPAKVEAHNAAPEKSPRERSPLHICPRSRRIVASLLRVRFARRERRQWGLPKRCSGEQRKQSIRAKLRELSRRGARGRSGAAAERRQL